MTKGLKRKCPQIGSEINQSAGKLPWLALIEYPSAGFHMEMVNTYSKNSQWGLWNLSSGSQDSIFCRHCGCKRAASQKVHCGTSTGEIEVPSWLLLPNTQTTEALWWQKTRGLFYIVIIRAFHQILSVNAFCVDTMRTLCYMNIIWVGPAPKTTPVVSRSSKYLQQALWAPVSPSQHI